MKKLFPYLITLLLITACSENSKTVSDTTASSTDGGVLSENAASQSLRDEFPKEISHATRNEKKRGSETPDESHGGSGNTDEKVEQADSSGYVASGIEAELMENFKPRNKIERARNSTLFIDSGFGTGSGFFFDENCTIVTNKHVVQLDYPDIKNMKLEKQYVDMQLKRGVVNREEREKLHENQANLEKALKAFKPNGIANRIVITLVNGRELMAKLIMTSKRYDLAYLYISDSGCVPLEPLMDRDLPLAHKVFTIGNPAGMKYTVTSGIVSGYHEHKDVEYIQTDAAINPGNSGGPLIDEEGRLLGVNSMILLDTEGIGFALPAALVVEDYQENREYIEKLLETHEFKHWMSSISSYMSDEENQELEQQIDLAAANCAKEFEDEQWGVALEECQFAADYEHAHSQYLLAKLYFERDDDVREDIAIGLLEKAALNGSAEALYLLAGFRRDGEFVEKNIELSTEMYSESCEKLFYKSCEQLAYYYRKRHDWDNVRKYLEKAIDSGSVVAYYSLGLLYRLGYGVEIDKEKSFELNRKAAMLGANRAQHFIAWQYYEGNGVDKKYQEAYKWLVVSEVDEQDYYDDWDTDVPGNLRFYLYNMLSDRERQDQVEKARVLIEEITANLEAHKSKYSHFASEIPDIAAVEKSKEANSQEDEATVEKMEEKNQPGSDAPPESDDSADKDKIEVL